MFAVATQLTGSWLIRVAFRSQTPTCSGKRYKGQGRLVASPCVIFVA
jgi:hypothetical protein